MNLSKAFMNTIYYRRDLDDSLGAIWHTYAKRSSEITPDSLLLTKDKLSISLINISTLYTTERLDATIISTRLTEIIKRHINFFHAIMKQCLEDASFCINYQDYLLGTVSYIRRYGTSGIYIGKEQEYKNINCKCVKKYLGPCECISRMTKNCFVVNEYNRKRYVKLYLLHPFELYNSKYQFRIYNYTIYGSMELLSYFYSREKEQEEKKELIMAKQKASAESLEMEELATLNNSYVEIQQKINDKCIDKCELDAVCNVSNMKTLCKYIAILQAKKNDK